MSNFSFLWFSPQVLPDFSSILIRSLNLPDFKISNFHNYGLYFSRFEIIQGFLQMIEFLKQFLIFSTIIDKENKSRWIYSTRHILGLGGTHLVWHLIFFGPSEVVYKSPSIICMMSLCVALHMFTLDVNK